MKSKKQPKLLAYVPHGLNHNLFRPITKGDEEYASFKEFKQQIFKGKEYDFVMFFNSRNIRRKQIPDTLVAYKLFIDSLTEEQAHKCAFLLHTQVLDDNGTDLAAVCEYLFDNNPKYNIIFSQTPLPPQQMNYLYNMSDVQILLTSNEGWGLSLTEAILVGNPIIANVTGGMQDQMRFIKDGKWMELDADFPSNHKGTIKEHGEWAFPVYPTNRSIQGSPITPYIWDDRCTAEDASEQIMYAYKLGRSILKQRGLVGREWAIGDEAGFTSEKMGQRIIKNLDELFSTWAPREKFELLNSKDIQKKVLNHKLVY